MARRKVGGLVLAWALFSAAPVRAHTIDLLRETFERPLLPHVASCGEAVDARPVAQKHAPPRGRFAQTGRIETLLLGAPGYANPEGLGGAAAMALRSDGGSRFAWIFDAEFLDYMNIALTWSPIEVRGCGGPFGLTRPKLRISVYDAPEGVFALNGDREIGLKDSVEVQGATSADPWTFSWTSALVSLRSGDPTDGHIAIVFELIEGGYAVLDNLAIVGSHEEGDLGDGGFTQDPDGGAPDAGVDAAMPLVSSDAGEDVGVLLDASAPAVDAPALVDGAGDAASPARSEGGCGCRVGRSASEASPHSSLAFLLVFAVVHTFQRRARARPNGGRRRKIERRP